MPLFYQPAINQGVHFLDSEESRHCTKVLRLKQGDSFDVIDGLGTQFTCIITDPNPRKCLFDILEKKGPEPDRDFKIHIAIAPTKNIDRIEWFVEKAVEMGIEEISFIKCKNSERTTIKMERINRKAVSAMKQSRNIKLPKINELQSVNDFYSLATEKSKFICHVDDANPDLLYQKAKSGNTYCVLIGPEGDFTNEELTSAREHGFVKVSLGHSRLRTETAGISACHTLNLINH